MNAIDRKAEIKRAKKVILSAPAKGFQRIRIIVWGKQSYPGQKELVESIFDITEYSLEPRRGYLPVIIANGKDIAAFVKHAINRALDTVEGKEYRIGFEGIFRDQYGDEDIKKIEE